MVAAVVLADVAVLGAVHAVSQRRVNANGRSAAPVAVRERRCRRRRRQTHRSDWRPPRVLGDERRDDDETRAAVGSSERRTPPLSVSSLRCVCWSSSLASVELLNDT